MTDQHPLPAQPPHIGPIVDDRSGRDRIGAHELAIVLSHYGIGIIRKIREYPRGSRRAPKLVIRSDDGEYLLKRRAPGRDDPYRVAFSHSLQLHLAETGFPVPSLVGTRNDHNSLVQHHGRIYELFDYVRGRRYDRSPASTARVGAALGRLHRLLDGFSSPYEPPRGTYHAADGAEALFDQVVSAVTVAEPGAERAPLERTVSYLRQAYVDAAQRVKEAGYESWPRTVLHGDWHPGNVLFRDGEVVAVLDFDSARIEPRMADVANGALQFSLTMTDPDDPLRWPERLDVERMRAFLRGCDSAAGEPIRGVERQAIPWLIIEALVIESIIPITATGTFGGLSGSRFLTMVERKTHWLRPRAAKLVRYLEEAQK
jgi:homoserine kinase type II